MAGAIAADPSRSPNRSTFEEAAAAVLVVPELITGGATGSLGDCMGVRLEAPGGGPGMRPGPTPPPPPPGGGGNPIKPPTPTTRSRKVISSVYFSQFRPNPERDFYVKVTGSTVASYSNESFSFQ